MPLFDFQSVRVSRGAFIHFLHDARSFPELAESAQVFLEKVNATEPVGDTVTIPSSEREQLALLLEGVGYRRPTPHGHWGVYYTYATSIGAIGFSASISSRPHRIPNFYHNPSWPMRFEESTRPFFVKLVSDHVELVSRFNHLYNFLIGSKKFRDYRRLSAVRELLDQMERALELQYVNPNVVEAEKIIPLQKEGESRLAKVTQKKPGKQDELLPPPSSPSEAINRASEPARAPSPPLVSFLSSYADEAHQAKRKEAPGAKIKKFLAHPLSTSPDARGIDLAAQKYAELANQTYGEADGKKEADLFIASLLHGALYLYEKKDTAPERFPALIDTLVSLALANLVTNEFVLRVMDDVVQPEIVQDRSRDEKLLAIRGLAFQIADFTWSCESECLEKEHDFRSQYRFIMQPPKKRDPSLLEWYESFKKREPSATNPLNKWKRENGMETVEESGRADNGDAKANNDPPSFAVRSKGASLGAIPTRLEIDGFSALLDSSERDKPQAFFRPIVGDFDLNRGELSYLTDGNTALRPLEESLAHFIEPLSANDDSYPDDPLEPGSQENQPENFGGPLLPQSMTQNVWQNTPSLVPFPGRPPGLAVC